MLEKRNLNLLDTVVDGGYCIGCGACASIDNSPLKIKLDTYSRLQAVLDDESLLSSELNEEDLERVCPFSDKSIDEDVLGKSLFSDNAVYHDMIGYHMSTYAGHVLEGDYRSNGSSGGMGSWIANNMLKKGLVDYIVHIHSKKPTSNDKRLFAYNISSTAEQVTENSKSRYYPIEMSQIIQIIKKQEGRYVIVGVPCFIKAIRLVSNIDSILKQRIKFCIGLVCGHLKTTGFAEMVAWQNGISPKNLTAIDFRTKIEGSMANRYGVTVSGIVDNSEVNVASPPISSLFGTSWGYGLFKYNACDYCDDVVAETADVTIGDAWLPQYVNDSQGTNVIIIRNPVIDAMFKEAISQELVKLDQITPNEVVKSQKSGFDHRRQGLAYRLFLLDKAGKWRPKKRVEASESHLSKKRKKIQLMRMVLAKESHTSFIQAIDDGTFETFRKRMEPLLHNYSKLYQESFFKKLFKKLKKTIS